MGIYKSDSDFLTGIHKLFLQFMSPKTLIVRLWFIMADQTTKSLARSNKSENRTRFTKWRVDQSSNEHLEFLPLTRNCFWLYIASTEFEQPQKYIGNHCYITRVNCGPRTLMSQWLGFTWQNREQNFPQRESCNSSCNLPMLLGPG